MRDFATQRLINAGMQLNWLVVEAGRILSRYVQPGSISKDDARNELLSVFDGPAQRAAQKAWREAVEQADGHRQETS
jgi:hypothetical protein